MQKAVLWEARRLYWKKEYAVILLASLTTPLVFSGAIRPLVRVSADISSAAVHSLCTNASMVLFFHFSLVLVAFQRLNVISLNSLPTIPFFTNKPMPAWLTRVSAVVYAMFTGSAWSLAVPLIPFIPRRPAVLAFTLVLVLMGVPTVVTIFIRPSWAIVETIMMAVLCGVGLVSVPPNNPKGRVHAV